MNDCPFCGGSDLHLSSNGYDNAYVECSTCGAQGPSHETNEAAIKEWNHRS